MVRLEKVNGSNIWEILKLRVGEKQKSFVAPNDTSIIEAYIAVTHHGNAFPFGIYEEELPVGFCMIGYDADDDWEDAPAVARGNYNLWRFMIDERYQGKGYGKAAMKLVLDFISGEPCGPAKYCWLSYEPENTAAKALYASFGFRETGEWDGNETIAVRRLRPETDGETLINRFAEQTVSVLKDDLAGIYLHGSAAMGCYHPGKSDLDFLIVVNRPLSDSKKREYMDMVVKLDEGTPGKGIEMSVVTRDVCNPFLFPTPFILHYSRMHTAWYREKPEDYIRKMNGTDPDLAAHFTVVCSRGLCLYGLPIDRMFGPVPEEDYLESIWNDVSGAEKEITENPPYLILNLARVLAYLREGEVLSKQEGGEWGLNHLPKSFHPIIRSALYEYKTGTDTFYDPEQARGYAAYMLKQISETLQNREPEEGELIPAAPEDAEMVAVLACELWPEHTPEELTAEYESLLSGNETAVFLYFRHKRPVGFAQCQLRHDYVEGTETSPVGYLEGIYVKKSERRHGIARKLLNACEVWTARKGCSEFASDCEITNTTSQLFHRATGFQEANRIVAYVRKI